MSQMGLELPGTTNTVAAITEPAITKSADTTVAAPVANGAVKKAAPKRSPASKLIGVSINQSRTRRFLDKNNLNKAVEEALAPLAVVLNEYNSAETSLKTGNKTVVIVEQETVQKTIKKKQADGTVAEEVVDQVKNKSRNEVQPLTDEDRVRLNAVIAGYADRIEKIRVHAAALRSSRIRFSNDAALALSIICNRALTEISEHAIAATVSEGKKIVHTNHVFADGVTDLSLYPLVSTLPSFVAATKDHDDRVRDAHVAKLVKESTAAALKAWRAEHPTRRKKPGAKKTKAPAAVPEPVPLEEVVVADATPEEEEESSGVSSFAFYIREICKAIKKAQPEFSKIRISSDFCEFLSTVNAELINRLGRLMLHLTEAMNNKTINSESVLCAVKLLLIDNHSAVDTVELVAAKCTDPVALEAERAARKADPNYVKKPLSSLAQVDTVVAKRSTSYPTSSFDAVANDVREKLAMFSDAVTKQKEANAAAAAEETDDAE